MNEYHGEERREYTPIEVRKVSNGAKWGAVAAIVSLMMMALAIVGQLVIMARWTGKVETLLQTQVEDTAELKQDMDVHEGRLNGIEQNDVKILERLNEHMRTDG